MDNLAIVDSTKVEKDTLFPIWLPQSHWLEHIPFAYQVVELCRPRVFVEIGVFAGASYCAFCQKIKSLGIPCQALGVDNWVGDPHNGVTPPEVLDQLKTHHDPLYSSFSRLVKSTFDEALQHVPDASIDLLHIDGYHTYEAVKHDYDNWLPKMSDRGVILFHDTNVREFNFGVWKLWEEVSAKYPRFNFLHEHGLGVLGVGKDLPQAMVDFFAEGRERTAQVREQFSNLGKKIRSHARLTHQAEELKQKIAEIAALNQIRTAESEAYSKQIAAAQAAYEHQFSSTRSEYEEQRIKEHAALEQRRVNDVATTEQQWRAELQKQEAHYQNLIESTNPLGYAALEKLENERLAELDKLKSEQLAQLVRLEEELLIARLRNERLDEEIEGLKFALHVANSQRHEASTLSYQLSVELQQANRSYLYRLSRFSRRVLRKIYRTIFGPKQPAPSS